MTERCQLPHSVSRALSYICNSTKKTVYLDLCLQQPRSEMGEKLFRLAVDDLVGAGNDAPARAAIDNLLGPNREQRFHFLH